MHDGGQPRRPCRRDVADRRHSNDFGRTSGVTIWTGQLRAGSARRDITQPIGTPAGLSLTERVKEVWDPLTATVVVLEQGGARVVIVALDVVGVLEASHRAIRSGAARAADAPEEHVILVASHTH